MSRADRIEHSLHGCCQHRHERNDCISIQLHASITCMPPVRMRKCERLYAAHHCSFLRHDRPLVHRMRPGHSVLAQDWTLKPSCNAMEQCSLSLTMQPGCFVPAQTTAGESVPCLRCKRTSYCLPVRERSMAGMSLERPGARGSLVISPVVRLKVNSYRWGCHREWLSGPLCFSAAGATNWNCKTSVHILQIRLSSMRIRYANLRGMITGMGVH